MQVDFVDGPPTVGDVHEPILDDWRAFEPTVAPDAAALDPAERHRPGDMQPLHVVAVDLIERRVALRGVIVVVVDPVVLFLRRVEQSLLSGVIGGRRGSKRAGGKPDPGNRSYDSQQPQ